PSEIEAISDPVARRTFLKLMGASLALAGVTGCTRQPADTSVPYVRHPEDLIPSSPLFYATAMSLGGVATGLLVESHYVDPASREHVRGGAKLAFGEYVDAQYRFGQADVILSLDADVLGCGPGSIRYARDFAARRRPEQADRMNRLYAIESMPTSTGARAD